jgi:hypothetical protein
MHVQQSKKKLMAQSHLKVPPSANFVLKKWLFQSYLTS